MSKGSGIDSLLGLSSGLSLGLLLGLLLGLSSGLLLGLLLGLSLGLPALVKMPALVSSSLGRGLVLPLPITLGITISKLFCTSKRELIIRINSLFLGLLTYLRSGGYNCILVINKFAELP